MNRTRKAITAAVIGGSVVAGGAVGALLSSGGAISSSLASDAQALAVASTSPSPGAAKRGSNEDATHEKSESASREAAENSGTFRPGGAFKPNEDATHEKSESAAREKQEDSGQRPTVP